MKLYNANFSPNTLRVRAVAHELGIALVLIEVDLRAGDHRAEAFLAINPNGKVPALVDGDFTLWESRAITGYLASQKPEAGLYPSDPKTRATIDQWLYWQAIHLGPAMQKVAFEKFAKQKFGMGEPDQAIIDAEMKNVDQFLQVLESSLSGKDWIAGQLSIADFALASTFMFRAPSDISLADYPNVARWIDQMEARDAWQTSVAPLMAMMGA